MPAPVIPNGVRRVMPSVVQLYPTVYGVVMPSVVHGVTRCTEGYAVGGVQCTAVYGGCTSVHCTAGVQQVYGSVVQGVQQVYSRCTAVYRRWCTTCVRQVYRRWCTACVRRCTEGSSPRYTGRSYRSIIYIFIIFVGRSPVGVRRLLLAHPWPTGHGYHQQHCHRTAPPPLPQVLLGLSLRPSNRTHTVPYI